MENLLKKIDWAEIAGECINHGQEVGYIKAMVMVYMYDYREEARTASEYLMIWNRTAKVLKKQSQFKWEIKDDERVQQAYRNMVRANSISRSI